MARQATHTVVSVEPVNVCSAEDALAFMRGEKSLEDIEFKPLVLPVVGSKVQVKATFGPDKRFNGRRGTLVRFSNPAGYAVVALDEHYPNENLPKEYQSLRQLLYLHPEHVQVVQ